MVHRPPRKRTNVIDLMALTSLERLAGGGAPQYGAVQVLTEKSAQVSKARGNKRPAASEAGDRSDAP
ncbi:hypothetical protein [Cohnella faecalis]|uniref:Uncharacterized protein n=1 Tax=Cohnella faecalis TaxID=2315694 RepID=A0A398CVC3_9BACL|nr:hypothetical protein [Cohnella faecalis]RIE03857.1 hypothetical protein D3H35_09920 [Cohnella faecalis]